MDIRKYVLGDASPIKIGLTSSVFLTGFIGVVILPFYLYLFGAGIFWQFLGVLINIVIIWNLESYRLMRYAKRSKRILTIPGYLEHRFGSKGFYVRVFASVEIIILSLVINALILKEAAFVFGKIFNMNVGTISILIMSYITLAIGWFGVNFMLKSARIRAIFLLVVISFLVVFLLMDVGISTLIRNMMATDITGSVSNYLNVLFHNGEPLELEDYISMISMGFLASGMPFMLGLFFAEEDGKAIRTGKMISLIFVILFFMVLACLGAVSRGVLFPEKITNSLSEYITLLFERIDRMNAIGAVFSAFYMVVIFLGFSSALEGSLHATISSVYEDILISGRIMRINHKNDRRNLFIIAVLCGAATVVLSMCIIQNSFAVILVFIATLGCSISPTVFMSIVWKRMNRFGALAGLITGLVSVPLFKYAHLFRVGEVKGSLCDLLGINSVIPSMMATFTMIMLVSLITPKPEEKYIDEFMEVRNRITE